MGKNKKHKNKEMLEEEELVEEAEEELEEVKNEDWSINEEKVEELNGEEELYKDKYIKLQADFENFKSRIAREKDDMIFFLKQDILLKILPRVDDLERIIANTPVEEKNTSVYEGVVAMEKKIKDDLEKLWVKTFSSKWEEVNPDRHEVMTTMPWKKEWVICDEFEKWYELNWRVLRHAKVVAWAWE